MTSGVPAFFQPQPAAFLNPHIPLGADAAGYYSTRPLSDTLEDLIECYARGVFPMAETRDDERVFLVDPDLRGVLPLEGFHVPARLARTVRSDRFEVRIDTAFETVVEQCALPRPGRDETWINDAIRQMYQGLFSRGLAHSVECWREGKLVGGLYGVSLGAAFFGESMF